MVKPSFNYSNKVRILNRKYKIYKKSIVYTKSLIFIIDKKSKSTNNQNIRKRQKVKKNK